MYRYTCCFYIAGRYKSNCVPPVTTVISTLSWSLDRAMARCWLVLVLLPLLSTSVSAGNTEQFSCSQEFTREAELYTQARAKAHT